ncbi:MAG: hypothetical protein ACOYJ2_01030 [Rickettsiales bacterium]
MVEPSPVADAKIPELLSPEAAGDLIKKIHEAFFGGEEAVTIINWEAKEPAASFRAAKRGALTDTSAPSNERADLEAAIEAAISKLMAGVDYADDASVAGVIQAIRDCTDPKQLTNLVQNAQSVIASAAIAAQARDGDERQKQLDRNEIERLRLYSDWFGGDEDAVNRMMGYDRIAIYSDDPDAVRAADNAADDLIRSTAPNPQVADDRIAQRRQQNAQERIENRAVTTTEERAALIDNPELTPSEAIANVNRQTTSLDQALLAQVRSSNLNQTGVTTDGDPAPEPSALASRPVVVAETAAPSFGAMG